MHSTYTSTSISGIFSVACHRWEATTDAAPAPAPPPPPPLPPPPPRCPMHSQLQEPKDATARHHPLGRILIIETKAEQIRTNAFLVLQLESVRQNLVCGRVAPVVGKPFTTVLFPPSILEWSNTGVDENLADRLLCFLELQLLHVGLLIEKDPLQQGWFWRKPWGKRRMGSLVKQCFPYDT